MCGRYSIYEIMKMRQRFGLKHDVKIAPIYNAAPSMALPIILDSSSDEITMARWGLIPSWSRDEKIGYKMINARSETVDTKASFQRSFIERRCIIPANGFFEWKKTQGPKVPFRIELKTKEMFSFAGIWDVWKNGTGEDVISYTIITVDSTGKMADVHERMPVILDKGDESVWLDTPSKKYFKAYPSSSLDIYQISDKVNSVKNNSPDILSPITTLDGF